MLILALISYLLSLLTSNSSVLLHLEKPFIIKLIVAQSKEIIHWIIRVYREMSVNLESVTNQIGTATLDNEGNILSITGEMQQRPEACKYIYNILLDTGKCLQLEPLKRLTISYSDHSYLATIGKDNIYIVKVSQSS